jgi:hypothetical protein
MVSSPSLARRDEALRELLVEQADASRANAGTGRASGVGSSGWTPSWTRSDRPALLATVAVVVLVLAASIAALGLVPALRGASPADSFSGPRPEPTITGRVLGTWSSDEKPPVHARFDTHGLALAVIITCSGKGSLFVSIPHEGDESGGCGGVSTSVGNKAHSSPAYLTVRPTGHVRWTVTVKGVRETYVTPMPVATARAADGAAVPFCAPADLSVSYGLRTLEGAVPRSRTGQLTFTNTGPSRCALAGYPTIHALAGGKAVGHHANDWIDERSSIEHGLKPVLLAPGGHAYVQLGTTPAAQTDQPCRPATSSALRVELANRLAGPGQAGALDVRVPSFAACANPKALQLFRTVFLDYGLPR